MHSGSYDDIYYNGYGMLCEWVGDDGAVWVLVPVGDVVLRLL